MLSGSKLTAECDDRERFKRLLEVIGGYPLIGGGYRPLDFPHTPFQNPLWSSQVTLMPFLLRLNYRLGNPCEAMH